MSRNRTLAVSLLLLISGCATGVGKSVERLPLGGDGYVVIGESLRLPKGRLPLYCGPESLCAVLLFYGKTTNVELVAGRIYDARRGGTLPTALIAFAHQIGYTATPQQGSIGSIKNYIDQATPPIIEVEIRPGLFHYFVVIGYSDPERTVVCMDYDGYKLIGYEELLKAWAVTKYEMIIIRKGTAESELSRGADLYNAGRYKAALRNFRRAVDLEPDHVDARVGLGDCLRALDKKEEAAEAYEEALKRSPREPRALNNLADLLVELNRDLPRAEKLAEMAVDRFKSALERTRRDFAIEQNPAQKEQLKDELFEREIYVSFSLDTLAKIRFKNGKFALAAAAWRSSLDLLPLTLHDYRAKRMLNLARANKKMKMGSKARTWLNKALKEAKDETLRAEIKKEMNP